MGQSENGNPPAGPLVVKLGGKALDDPGQSPWLWEALCVLHRSHRGGVVLVHGGGAAVDRQLERLGLVSERREGIRVTPQEHLNQIVGVLAGTLNKSLVGWIRRSGVAAVGLCLGDGDAVRTSKTTRFAFDPGRVGEVIGGEGRLLRTLLGAGFLPVLCSIGLDDAGEALNVNADEAAAGVAAVAGAAGLLLLTDVPGVLDASRRLLPELTAAEADALIAAGTIHGGMIPKVRGAVQAAQAAGVPATIASWNGPDDLLRLAKGERVGTTFRPATQAGARPEPAARV
jgi:acetylglutamate kinase